MYRTFLATALAVTLAMPLAAQTATDTAAASGQAATAVAYTEAEVKKIDVEQGKVTLKHGRIENLDMPGMTMVFRLADAALVADLKVGDAVLFKADRVAGGFRVTELKAR